MKRVYLTLMMMASLATVSFAQMGPNNKDIDLSVNMLHPVDSLPNAGFGDSMSVYFEISNNGTVAYSQVAGDVLHFYMTTELFGQDVYTQSDIVNFTGPDSFNLAIGQTDTLYLTTVEGTNLFSNGTGEIDYPDDAKICYKLAVWGGTLGLDSAGDSTTFFFNDPDFSGQDFNAWAQAGGTDRDALFGSFSGGNISEVTVYFGSGEEDICLNGFPGGPNAINSVNADGIGMTVYPNPVSNNQLNLTYTTNTTAKVSVKIVDLTGRVVATQDLGQVNTGTEYFKVNVANLSSGMYMLEAVSDKGNRQVIKFTKK